MDAPYQQNFVNFSTYSGSKKFEVSSKTPCSRARAKPIPVHVHASINYACHKYRKDVYSRCAYSNSEDAHNRDARVCKQQMLAKIIGDLMDWTPDEGRRLAQSRRTVAFGLLETSQTKLQSLKSYSYLKVISSLRTVQGRYWRRVMASLKPRSCARIQDRTSL